jgi:signal transduction histidine kinase
MNPLGFLRRSLRRRLILLVGLWMVALAAILLMASLWGSREVTDRALDERLYLAKALANNMDQVLKSNLVLLQEASLNVRSRLERNDLKGIQEILRETYFRSIFTEGVFLLDDHGKEIWAEPHHSAAGLGELSALRSGRPEISNLVPNRQQRVIATIPVSDWRGNVVGVIGGELDPRNPRFSSLIHAVRLGETVYLDVVDGRGTVLASTKTERMFTDSDHGRFLVGLIQKKKAIVGSCHGCHERGGFSDREREVIAFAPLANAPWGLSIRQAESEALAPVFGVERNFLVAGSLTTLVALFFAWGMARSVTMPLKVLAHAAARITQGDLQTPIRSLGEDEIGSLARSLDQMRVTLKASVDAIAEGKRQLEERVRERTHELQTLYQELQKQEGARGELLKKLILAQEEERKRIARELHDETSQDLATFLLSAETSASGASGTLREGFLRMKAIANRALDSIHRLIYDLRPSVLDDLGLSSALRWVAENRIESLGIDLAFNVIGVERRLEPLNEIALFRIGQEAISNIVRHAEANAVRITLEYGADVIRLEVEDNGKGFQPERVLTTGEKSLGLLGMRERASLIGGHLSVVSTPESGTLVRVEIPVNKHPGSEVGNHGKDQSAHC